ncbi:hypothetical protein KFE25_001969 [Diacronema lutheri]|uniref:Uncharacterized protein n=1 Tax=Diacronema lutheri TaxID=2081491 RepID=A0A8J5XK82_DIALT|nr:hypothetical protein KFE25_001969 [Diacronema lutheri]
MAVVRPPAWEKLAPRTHLALDVDSFKRRQQGHLARWRTLAQQGAWRALHADHFDWWMFPIDDGSQPQFNVRCEADIARLLADDEWREGYAEGVATCVRAWGWDAHAGARIERDGPDWDEEMGWMDWDVRLAKVVRSLWLFQHALFPSIQALARSIHADEKGGRAFTYGHLNLNEILHMTLPRTRPAIGLAALDGASSDADSPAGQAIGSSPAAEALPAADVPHAAGSKRQRTDDDTLAAEAPAALPIGASTLGVEVEADPARKAADASRIVHVQTTDAAGRFEREHADGTPTCSHVAALVMKRPWLVAELQLRGASVSASDA